MKKWFMICMALLLSLSVLACTTTTTATTTATTTTTTATPDAEVLGNYVGTHSVSAMGSDVTYNYLMSFDAAGAYAFHSVFVMGETEYTFDEVGTFVTAGNVITITPEGGAAVAGTVNADGSLAVSVKASAMGSRAIRTLVPSLLEYGVNYVGGHTVSAMGSDVNYRYTITFQVNKTYEIFSTFIMGETTYTYEEVGTFTLAAGVLTITPQGGDAVVGAINANGSIDIGIKASTMGARTSRNLVPDQLQYNVAYEGTHTVSAMGSDVVYVYTIVFDLLGGYAFHSDFTMGETPYTFDESGTFTLVGAVLTITPVLPTAADAVAGSLNADGSVTVAVKASTMGARTARTLSIPEPVPAA